MDVWVDECFWCWIWSSLRFEAIKLDLILTSTFGHHVVVDYIVRRTRNNELVRSTDWNKNTDKS